MGLSARIRLGGLFALCAWLVLPRAADALDDALDTDADGLCDVCELDLGTDPTAIDTDGDLLGDGYEAHVDIDFDGAADPDVDRDGLHNALDHDSDGDARADIDEGRSDRDADGVVDAFDRYDDDGPLGDVDGDGVSNAAEWRLGTALDRNDTDRDGLDDDREELHFLNPRDADSDDDGVLDGTEERWAADTDGDGLINALDPDSDDDGLPDGLEMGVSTPSDGTNLDALTPFRPDLSPDTTTDPLSARSNGFAFPDGMMDPDRDGAIDPGDDGFDADLDRLSDAQEWQLGTDPRDDDSDDDGLADGDESNPAIDTDGDGLINALDWDSDGDWLPDGLERGVGAPRRGTDLAAGRFRADLDPESVTSMVMRDTDRGGREDGAEDPNRDGRIDAGEGDGRTRVDDASVPLDLDADGLSFERELSLGTDPFLTDTDGDGMSDAQEVLVAGRALDIDADGVIDPLDWDSDGDGWLDLMELLGAPVVANGDLVPRDTDGDGAPDYRDRDSDDGGIDDGAEVLAGTDPRDATDDGRGQLEPGGSVRGGGSSAFGCAAVGAAAAGPGSLLAVLALALAWRRRRRVS